MHIAVFNQGIFTVMIFLRSQALIVCLCALRIVFILYEYVTY